MSETQDMSVEVFVSVKDGGELSQYRCVRVPQNDDNTAEDVLAGALSEVFQALSSSTTRPVCVIANAIEQWLMLDAQHFPKGSRERALHDAAEALTQHWADHDETK